MTTTMKTIKPTVVIKHKYGYTAQWHDIPNNRMVMAMYSRQKDGFTGLTYLAGPWSGTETIEGVSTPIILPGHESLRFYVLSEAEKVLLALNSRNQAASLKQVFKGDIIGFE